MPRPRPHPARDPLYRLRNFYAVRDEDRGSVVPFRPRPQQEEIYRAIYERGERSIIVLKSRRLGMSTGIDIAGADAVWFSGGTQFSIVDQTAADAQRKLRSIVGTAWRALPRIYRDSFDVLTDSQSEFIVRVDDDSESLIAAGLNARGGTNHWLHISEWGPIQFRDLKRSEEILTGALPSARRGVRIVETTWKGRKGGHLWDLVNNSLTMPEEVRSPTDWRVYFFPWWSDPHCVDPGPIGAVDPGTLAYLAEVEQKIGRTLTDAQKVWYWKEERTLGLFMFSEYPSTIEECWKAPVEGAIYQDEIEQAVADGRVHDFPYDPGSLVHTFWDIGAPDQTSVIYMQRVGLEYRILDHDEGMPWRVDERVANMLARGYSFGAHYLPHDADALRPDGLSFAQQLRNHGLRNVITLPRTNDPWLGINRALQLLPQMRFHRSRTEFLREALSNYHRDTKAKADMLNPLPAHDWSSHSADALRTMAEADLRNHLREAVPQHPHRRRRRDNVKIIV